VATDAEPTQAPGWGLFAEWHALIDRGDPRFTLVAQVQDAAQPINQLAAKTRASVWNMQRHNTIDDLGDPLGLEAEARRRGLELRYILPRRVAESRNPLVSSYYPYLRLGPVAHPLLISDRRRILVGDATGETVWASTDAGVLANAVGLFQHAWDAARPAVPEGADPPFTRRMVDIGVLLARGATDREIARTLGVSERTVSADVREMSTRLGARSRAHAIAIISGLDG
jgi:DNA-binding CsgD family transcriptional regulator